MAGGGRLPRRCRARAPHHFERKIDAQRWLDEVTASLVTGQYVDPRAGRARCQRTGLELGTHDLRHFFASALIAGGASVKQAQTVLGHASATITLRTYAHLWPGRDDRTRSVIDSTLDVLRTGRGAAPTTEGRIR